MKPNFLPALRHAGLVGLVWLCAGLTAAPAPAAAAPSDARYATLTLQDLRHFNLTARTQISLDGRTISPSELGQIGAGFNTHVTVSNAAAGLSGGDAEAVRLDNLLKGPVTSLEPLRVLAQPIVVTADTVLGGLPSGGVAALALGDLVEVSGYADANGAIVASRLHGGLDPQADWKLSGTVSGLAGSSLHIGAQAVDIGDVVPANCAPALADGRFVEIHSLSTPTFVPGDTLGSVIAVACEERAFDDPPAGEHAASLEGVVDAVPDPPTSPFSFSLSGVTVRASASTLWHGGSVDDVDEGVRLDAEGTLDSATATLDAAVIRFVRPELRFVATLAPADVVPGAGLSIFGNAVVFNPQTRDDDGIAAIGLSAPRQVEVRAYVDADGTCFATRVRRRNGGGATLRLSGPVAAVAGVEVEIQGVTVDTSQAVFRDADGLPLSAADFFAALTPGRVIEASGGSYDAATLRLTPVEVALEDDAAAAARLANGTVAIDGLSRGTATAVATDLVFATNFD